MPNELDTTRKELPPIRDALSGDSRQLAFTVVDGDGNSVDISDADVEWSLHTRAYAASETVLDGDDASVTIQTDGVIDPEEGEFRVDIDASASETLYGDYYHRPRIEQADGSVASWLGEIVLTG